MTCHQNSSNQPDGPMVSTYPDLWYLRHDDIFHDSDKGPKHVEMFRTKCQPKVGTDKMPTTEKSPVGILSGWHFVQLAFCLTTLFNHMSWWPIPKKSRSSVIIVIFQALKFFIWKDTSIITLEINRSSATSATFLRLNLAKLVNTTFSFP